MKRWIFLAVLVVAISAVATVAFQGSPTDYAPPSGLAHPVTSAASGPQPKAVIDEPLTYAFGTKAQHTKFDREWIVKNEGQAELELVLEAPPCSCTVANFGGAGKSKVKVPPGGKIPLHFTWDTRGYTGKYEKPATLLTNDPARPKMVFKAEGKVVPAVVVFPEEQVNFLEVTTDEETHTVKIPVFSPDRPELKLLKFVTSKPALIFADKKPLTPEECKALDTKAGYVVEVTVKRGLPLGVFREELVITTDHPKRPEVRLPVTGKMVGPVTIVPERVRLMNISGSTGGKAILTMLVRGHRDTKFEVEHKPATFKVEIAPGDNVSKVSKYVMTVTVPPGTPSGEIEDEIVLKTDHPQAGEVRIPVTVLVRDSG